MKSETAEFDQFAGDYDSLLNQGLSISGESKDFYAAGRIAWFARSLRKLNVDTRNASILDYGCGTGTSAGLLRDTLSAGHVLGVDVSTEELAVARQTVPWASFKPVSEYVPDATADLVYCNGTFHHIPPEQRPAVVKYIHSSMKPGGYFALWENNPWNPGTRYVMSKILFDRNAITLSPPESGRLLRSCGFEIVSTTFAFVFPRMLSVFRKCEPWIARLPIGAQYQVLCRKQE